MLRVSNRACIRQLAARSFRASRSRNLIAVLAIMLTTILFTTLFTVGLSINQAVQQSNFRQVGGFAHGSFKFLTQEQFLRLRDDPLIRQWGISRVLGFAQNDALRKNHVELRWANDTCAHWMFLDPIQGRLPQEGTNEAATDLEVLQLLGVEPKIGSQFTIEADVGGQQLRQTFTLCGWWEKDPITVANHILIPESRVNDVLEQAGITLPHDSPEIGSWNLDVMFQNTRHIQENLETILERYGYQCRSATEENYIATGVNWSYTGAQLSQNGDATTTILVLFLLLLIIFTGYLIIYNVFQISVVNDIRFYGLLKTIGTTGRQIKALLRRQALLLCAAGIPLGCLAGWFLGAWLTPMILQRLNDLPVDTLSISPVIFIGSALFSLFTVLLSCARPGRMASRVSPIEASRYTEGCTAKKQKKTATRFLSLQMAWANLGRSKGKSFVTILSLTLAVVMLQMTALFTNGFDMEKYLQDKAACDYILADGGYFMNNAALWDTGNGVLPESVIDDVAAQGGISQGGRIYGQLDALQQFAPQSWVENRMMQWGNSEQAIQYQLSHLPHTGDDRVMDPVRTYGMEPFVLDTLRVVEGDLSRLYEPGSHSIAAVYTSSDYNEPLTDSHWAKVGDTVTLRMPEAWEYYSPETGQVHDDPEAFGDQPFLARPSRYHDEQFTVDALVTVPKNLCYRYYGCDEFVMNAQTFQQLTGRADVMLYAFNTKGGPESGMEGFLWDYTQRINPRYGYESKQTYVQEFDSFRSMFLTVGMLLSFIVGLVGVLNFLNAILTSILTRKRELAMLQSIGMTQKQLNLMLITEGLLYALGSVLLALVLSVLAGPLAASVLGKMFWFFSYRPTFLPILIVAPLFALLGSLLPLLVCRQISRQSIVERLRQAEG